MKTLKIIGFVFIIATLSCILLILFPQLLFAHKVKYNDFTIYSTNEIPGEINKLLDTVQSNLEASDLYYDGLNQKVFLCNNQTLYNLMCYPARRTFAGNWTLIGYIVIAKADIKKNLAYRKMDNKTRSLVNLMTHETTHSLFEKKLGFTKYMELPTWKNEGYCDYIAKGGTLGFKEGIEDLCTDQNLKSYFTYRLAIEYLIEEKGLSIREIIDATINYEEVRKTLKTKHCSQSNS